MLDVPPIYIKFTWFVIILFAIAMTVTVAMLFQRGKVKRRKEYAGPPPAAEEIAYLLGGRDRAIRAALVARDLTSPGLRRAVAEAAAASLTGPALLTAPVVDALDGIAGSLQERGLLDTDGRPSDAGKAAMRDARNEYSYMWPGYDPQWADCTGDERAMAVAAFGDDVLYKIDPGLAAAYPVATDRA